MWAQCGNDDNDDECDDDDDDNNNDASDDNDDGDGSNDDSDDYDDDNDDAMRFWRRPAKQRRPYGGDAQIVVVSASAVLMSRVFLANVQHGRCLILSLVSSALKRTMPIYEAGFQLNHDLFCRRDPNRVVYYISSLQGYRACLSRGHNGV